MLKKGNKLYSILTGNCPKCHLESMYLESNPYILKNLFKMNVRCSKCNTKYKMEPSFFFGAMYVSYGLGVFLCLIIFGLAYLVLELNLIQTLVTICVVIFVFIPLNIRLSRNIWINLFIKYDAKAAKNYAT